VHIGTVTALNDERFSLELAGKALWEPFSAIEAGQAGIFFLEPYDPDKIPVLFIHGINGSPKYFKTLIESIDSVRFQPWVLQYPSGLRLTTISLGLHQMMEILKFKHGFDQAHVVAHSMGGLIGRAYVGYCIESNDCDYLQSLTTISSPLDGMKSADLGIEYAPTVVPVWNDLSPESEFIAGLFDSALPESASYSLLFTFRNEKLMSSGSSDGIVALHSQLRQAAQDQADFIYGLDETHVGILEAPHLLELVNTILDQASVQ
jgi:pimeloyl-ACP methyl ester carboxylesterase